MKKIPKIIAVEEEENRCVMCGEIIPEGRQVCPCCEKGYLDRNKNKAQNGNSN